jgi:hypothetical protein
MTPLETSRLRAGSGLLAEKGRRPAKRAAHGLQINH